MKKLLSILFLIVSTTVMGLKLYFLIMESYDLSLGFFILFIIISLMWVFTVVNVYINFFKDEESKFTFDDELYRFSLILASSLIVYFTYNMFNINSIIVVSLLTLIGGLFIKKFDKEITIGAFVGMGAFISSSYYGIIVASTIAYIVSYMLKDYLNGIGGKLGMMAFTGGLITYYVLDESFSSYITYQIEDLIILLIVSVVSAVITYILNNELKLGAIVSYSIVSLIGSLFLLFPYTKDLGLIGVVFGSSFVGMSSKDKVKRYLVIIMGGLLYGLFSYVGKSFNGLGGRGGTLAIISVLTAINFKYFCDVVLKKKDNKANYGI